MYVDEEMTTGAASPIRITVIPSSMTNCAPSDLPKLGGIAQWRVPNPPTLMSFP